MSTSHTASFTLFSFKGRTRTLHLTWLAFFISFLVWFNAAPLMSTLRDTFDLTNQQVKTLLILNVALTIPARIIIGMLVDKLGPRVTYSALLIISGFLSLLFAMAQTFEMLALTRFLLGFVGAGFVIGIRMIGEWFPARHLGVAEGIYGGWGNFGSAAAALSLPTLALFFGGDDGWRYAIASTGIIAILYGIFYFLSITDTPKGATYFKPNKVGAMEVSSKGDMILYALSKIPLLLALAVLAWKLGPDNLGLLGFRETTGIYLALSGLYFYQLVHIIKINRAVLTRPVADIHRYKFKQVAVLNLAYLSTFGSELAVVSMLPLFFQDTFSLSAVLSGVLAASFAFMNLIARPAGGILSDKFGRKTMLLVLLAGTVTGYLVLSTVDSSWSLILAVLATMGCSFFVQAGEGAVFAMVPLIKRRMTGQIAGNVGAYGNVGAVMFLTVLSFVTPTLFFTVIAGTAAVTFVMIFFFLEEPSGQMAEIMPDGSIEMIEVH